MMEPDVEQSFRAGVTSQLDTLEYRARSRQGDFDRPLSPRAGNFAARRRSAVVALAAVAGVAAVLGLTSAHFLGRATDAVASGQASPPASPPAQATEGCPTAADISARPFDFKDKTPTSAGQAKVAALIEDVASSNRDIISGVEIGARGICVYRSSPAADQYIYEAAGDVPVTLIDSPYSYNDVQSHAFVIGRKLMKAKLTASASVKATPLGVVIWVESPSVSAVAHEFAADDSVLAVNGYDWTVKIGPEEVVVPSS